MNSAEQKNSRDSLLEAGRRLFTEKGYQAVSTRELAESAGVNLGAIQYHFGSKAKLFVETIYSLMKESDYTDFRAVIERGVSTDRAPSLRLADFIFAFLEFLLRCEGPQPCRMMFREVLSDTSNDAELREALVSSFVHDFIQPVDNILLSIVRAISPSLHERELGMAAQSVIGQCAFFLTHRPFAERLRGYDVALSPYFEETASHIVQFTLRALRCDEKTIAAALEGALQVRKEKFRNA